VSPLDDPIGASLRGAHAGLAIAAGLAARYPAEVSPFACLAEASGPALADLGRIVSPGEVVLVMSPDLPLVGGWQVLGGVEVIQMVCATRLEAPEPTSAPEPLGAGDVAEMLELVEATRPGPFGTRTIEMGRYVGFRSAGRLVAMGGERLRPPGYTEVSGICTDPGFRGRGLGEAVVRAIGAGIQRRGEAPFLHVMVGSPAEAAAVALYERLGFRERRRARLTIVQRS
jgi:ribosomal protein S18 acetylase RimI-like enzyme